MQAAGEIADGSLDWVYIDGDHTYDAVRNDIATYTRKLRSGGWLTGDDYQARGKYHGGVKDAVDEAVASGALTLIAQRGRRFVLCTPAD